MTVWYMQMKRPQQEGLNKVKDVTVQEGNEYCIESVWNRTGRSLATL